MKIQENNHFLKLGWQRGVFFFFDFFHMEISKSCFQALEMGVGARFVSLLNKLHLFYFFSDLMHPPPTRLVSKFARVVSIPLCNLMLITV